MGARGAAFIIASALACTLAMSAAAAQSTPAQYPNFRGQWQRPDPGTVKGSVGSGANWDQSKPGGLRQEPPLMPEFQAIFEDNLRRIRNGDQTFNQQAYCLPSGMPRMMLSYETLEFIVTPEVTYVRSDHLTETRRIYTDGRDWPHSIAPSFLGYSIGKWVDEDGDGRFDALEAETHGFKGPRSYDANGIPFHPDNQTIIKERIYLDKANPNLLYDDVTTIDHALTRPWVVKRIFARVENPLWLEHVCTEDNHHVAIGGEDYFLSVDGLLMPTRKDQPPPDLRYFDQSQK
jgi:hypothetical protein